MKRNQKKSVFTAIRNAAVSHKFLTVGTILCVAASVLASLLPPLIPAGEAVGSVLDCFSDVCGTTPDAVFVMGGADTLDRFVPNLDHREVMRAILASPLATGDVLAGMKAGARSWL